MKLKLILVWLLMLMALPSAYADQRGHGQRHWGGHWGGYHNRAPNIDGSGILGGIIGGMIGGWLTRPEPEMVPVPVEPPGIEPWTQEWFDYCDGAYKSFDPKTGYWVGFDGRRHFCVAR